MLLRDPSRRYCLIPCTGNSTSHFTERSSNWKRKGLHKIGEEPKSNVSEEGNTTALTHPHGARPFMHLLPPDERSRPKYTVQVQQTKSEIVRPTMRCSERRRGIAVAIAAPRGRRRWVV